MWWATGFVLLTLVGLGALAWAALLMHAMLYGTFQVMDPGSVAAPEPGRYARALVVGCLVDVAGTAAMLRLLLRSTDRRWPAWASALLAAAVGGVVAASTLLLVVGVSPLSLLGY
ncbi:hypothetical protein [Terrabacter sp. NPDC080008]|uniref:hypothetical protein n=1 Tax=Terrabacter sp. NPDC080008 TaxID=3155176 RepID=UPI00344E27CE